MVRNSFHLRIFNPFAVIKANHVPSCFIQYHHVLDSRIVVAGPYITNMLRTTQMGRWTKGMIRTRIQCQLKYVLTSTLFQSPTLSFQRRRIPSSNCPSCYFRDCSHHATKTLWRNIIHLHIFNPFAVIWVTHLHPYFILYHHALDRRIIVAGLQPWAMGVWLLWLLNGKTPPPFALYSHLSALKKLLLFFHVSFYTLDY